jgi:transposase
MESNVKCYLGIDVSKLWFDLSIMKVIDHKRQPIDTERFDNTSEGIAKLHKWLVKYGVAFNESSLLVIENTGIYHRLIWHYCSDHSLPIYIGNAAHIKWSFGIARGKNDLIDSKRLCDYAYKQAEDLKANAALDPVYLKLKDLMTSRTMLQRQRNAIRVFLNELKGINDNDTQKVLEKANEAALKGLEKSMEKIEELIMATIKETEKVKKNYELLNSVPGLGHVIATYLICCTNNFAGNISGKQLSSYAGVVPFAQTSGSSVKGKNKVHKMANKELKALLHMAALSCIRTYPEFKEYYDRKIAEGKHSRSIINAIKNKLLLRAVAVIKKQQPYVDNTKAAA